MVVILKSLIVVRYPLAIVKWQRLKVVEYEICCLTNQNFILITNASETLRMLNHLYLIAKRITDN